ncbi:TetR/AcrR family transcriptional regulator [Nocardia sp. NPDC051030]|uniref:TetR/AcrR family transcriptional regulator n=1 Tax=Nocardia sp. NPDC051030 TaxID=3155162 RepID=UPI00341FE809
MKASVEAPAQLGRRERNKQRIHERIYEAAIHLFSEKGYEATTVDDIAERADVARGTFFNHFQRKEDLITEWVEQWRNGVLARLQLPLGLETKDTAAVLHLSMASLAQLTEEQRDLTETMLPAWVKTGRPLTEVPYTAEVFTRIIETGCRNGEIDPRVDPTLVGAMLRDVYLGALYRWVQHPSAPGQLGAELHDALHILLRGITVRAATPAH